MVRMPFGAERLVAAATVTARGHLALATPTRAPVGAIFSFLAESHFLTLICRY